MIASLAGTLAFRGTKYLIVEVGGVGYKVSTSLETAKTLPKKGERVELFTHLAVRETALELYGFSTMAELEMFEMLISISGIGPRSALGVLSVAPLDSLKRAIASGETAYLTKISGIGRKTAEKIMLELKDKLGGVDGVVLSNEETDALDALIALGYNAREAREVLHKLPRDIESIDGKLKEALKLLGKNK
jgi:Holliday junction DNA helicase RuvA